VARHRRGHHLRDSDLRVPREVLHRALQHRRELLSMNFDPTGIDETRPQNSIADLELRSVICVPLVRIRTGQGEATSVLSTGSETVGVLYMDSRVTAADLTGGNRELLQTLAIEASTVLENARLLVEERPNSRWRRNCNWRAPSNRACCPENCPPRDGWRARQQRGLARSGRRLLRRHRGRSALLVHRGGGRFRQRSRLGAAGIAAARRADHRDRRSRRPRAPRGAAQSVPARPHRRREIRHLFYSLLHDDGRLSYVNAAQCPPIVMRANGDRIELEATGMPVGLMEGAEFAVEIAAARPRRPRRNLQRRRHRGAESKRANSSARSASTKS
jgi:phosphoserine phosphatase RsbU/P